MGLRTFTTLDQLRSAPFDLPSTLFETAEDREARGEAWSAHHILKGSREIWTLVLPEDAAAIQWRDGERHRGDWIEERQAVKLQERRSWGLYSLEGRLLPADPFDVDDEEGGSYTPAFGKQRRDDEEG
ncbi:MAG: hypothetical protein U0P81_06780 [Holophagaceae bacterium]